MSNRQEQVACIFCGRCVIRDRLDLDKVSTVWDIGYKVLQVREMLAGPGRGHKGKNKGSGFPVIPEESLSIVELAQDSSYDDLVEALKSRLLLIVKAYIEAGIIDKSEI
ncbi:MAG: hypothetical protein E3J73_01085 [Candidatus Bathyarchaeum sp.]|nr:MAG: hypothetical protein E3J73_01085 [Candidatus Bathyarchaeum sp.]